MALHLFLSIENSDYGAILRYSCKMRLLFSVCVEFTKLHPLYDSLLFLGAASCPWRHLTNWWRWQDYQRLSLGTLLINFTVSQEKLVEYKVSWLSRWCSGKESACSVGDAGDVGLIPESGRSPGEGNGNTLQYSCLESSMDRGAWRATVHGVSEGRTRLSLHVQAA